MVIIPAGWSLLPDILRLLADDKSTRLGEKVGRLDDPERRGAHVVSFYRDEMLPWLASGDLVCSGMVVERGGDDPPLHDIAPVPPAAWRSAANAEAALREPAPGLAALFDPANLQFPAGVVSHGTAAFLPLFRLEEIRKWAARGRAAPGNTTVRRREAIEWMTERARTWPPGSTPPSEAEDWEAMKAALGYIPREDFRPIRKEATPDSWRTTGRPRLREMGRKTAEK